ncbi:MAG TPA: TonB-dependent receptor, partial [Vicinamibacterales bacterium]|nr:TonB-dependent receptor [Vicinamibacterales bacterium]
LSVSFEAPRLGRLDRVTVTGLFGTYDQRTDQDRVATAISPRSIERADVSANDFQVRAVADKLVSDVQLEFGLDVNGRVGLEAHDIAVAYDLSGAVVGQTDNLSIDSASRTDTGLFVQALTQAAPAVQLAGGVRVDVVRSANDGGFFGDRSITNSALAGLGSMTVGPFDGLSLTGQVSRGFRDPTLSDRFFRGPSGRGFITGNPDLEPETSLQFDLGARYARSRVRVTAYVYHYRIRNLVERFDLGDENFAFRNRGRAHITGVELEGQIDLGQGYALELAANLSRGDSPDDDEPLDDIGAPSLSAVVRKALADRGAAYVRVAGYARDDRPGPSEIAMPGWVDVDAGASWRFSPRLEIRAAARNLLNQAYYASPDPRWVYAPGRSASVTLVTGF